jgi:3-hydroxybutyryl-CoA dehydrogenase
MDIKNVAVIGGGTMGNGIAHVFASKGYSVTLIDQEEDILQRAVKTISSNLDRQLKKEVITADQKESTLANIRIIKGIENTPKDSDLVI